MKELPFSKDINTVLHIAFVKFERMTKPYFESETVVEVTEIHDKCSKHFLELTVRVLDEVVHAIIYGGTASEVTMKELGGVAYVKICDEDPRFKTGWVRIHMEMMAASVKAAILGKLYDIDRPSLGLMMSDGPGEDPQTKHSEWFAEQMDGCFKSALKDSVDARRKSYETYMKGVTDHYIAMLRDDSETLPSYKELPNGEFEFSNFATIDTVPRNEWPAVVEPSDKDLIAKRSRVQQAWVAEVNKRALEYLRKNTCTYEEWIATKKDGQTIISKGPNFDDERTIEAIMGIAKEYLNFPGVDGITIKWAISEIAKLFMKKSNSDISAQLKGELIGLQKASKDFPGPVAEYEMLSVFVYRVYKIFGIELIPDRLINLKLKNITRNFMDESRSNTYDWTSGEIIDVFRKVVHPADKDRLAVINVLKKLREYPAITEDVLNGFVLKIRAIFKDSDTLPVRKVIARIMYEVSKKQIGTEGVSIHTDFLECADAIIERFPNLND
jgi:hypothetical protein